MTLAESLRRFRKEFNLTQKQVAEAVGLAESAYQRYEQEIHKPSAALMMKISNAFDVSLDYLMGRTDDNTLLGRVENRVDMKAKLVESIAERLNNSGSSLRLSIITTIGQVEGNICRIDTAGEVNEVVKLMDQSLKNYPVTADLVSKSRIIFLEDVEIIPFNSPSSITIKRPLFALFSDQIVGIAISSINVSDESN